MRSLSRKIKSRYDESWLGKPATLTNGLLVVIFGALLSLGIALPYWTRQEASAARQRDLEAALLADYEDCVSRAQGGNDLKNVSMTSVEHAEDTAALMGLLYDLFERAAPESPLVDEFGVAVNKYVASVAEFRTVAEAYTPTMMSECDALPGAALAQQ